ncbi:MAG: hypothetical protein WEC14_09905 [Chloroflexota bacterium]
MTRGRPSRAWIVGVVGGLIAIAVIVAGVGAVLSTGGWCAGSTGVDAARDCRTTWIVAIVIAAIALVVFLGIALAAGLGAGGWAVRLPLLAWPILFVGVGLSLMAWAVERAAASEGAGAGDIVMGFDGAEIGMLIGAVALILLGSAPLPFSERIVRLLDGDR